MDAVLEDELYKKFEDKLIEESIVNQIQKIEETKRLDGDIIESLLTRPVPLELDERGQLVARFEDDKKEIIFDPRGENLPELTEFIPTCPFDTQCGGNRSKQQEAGAAWKVLLINKVAGGVYSKRIKVIMFNYDFDNLKDPKGGMPFFELLMEIQRSKNFVISMFLAAVNVKLSEAVEKKGTPYLGFVTATEAIKLETIKRKRSTLEYSKARDVKDAETKIERYMVIDQYEKQTRDMLATYSDEIQLLHRIERVDSNIVPYQKVVGIEEIADELIEKLICDKKLVRGDSGNKRIRKNLVRKGKRQFLAEFRKDAFARFASGQREDLLPKA
jgi:hypothetical protein